MDDPTLMPLARSRIAAMRASGLQFGSQRFSAGGKDVWVQIKGEQSYISIEVEGVLAGYLLRCGDVPIKTNLSVGKTINEKAVPDSTERGYNDWRGGGTIITYNSGRYLRYRLARVIPSGWQERFSSEYYAQNGMWVNGKKVETPFPVVSAARWTFTDSLGTRQTRLVAISLSSKPGATLPASIQGFLAHTELTVHMKDGDEWTVIGEFSVAGRTLNAMVNSGAVGYDLGNNSYALLHYVGLEDPIHFSPDGANFLVLVSPVASGPMRLGPVDGLAVETITVVGQLTFHDDVAGVTFTEREVVPINFDTVSVTHTEGLVLNEGTNTWYLGDQAIAPGTDANASASGIIGLDYADDGTELILTQSYSAVIYVARFANPAPPSITNYASPLGDVVTQTFGSVSTVNNINSHTTITHQILVNGGLLFDLSNPDAVNASGGTSYTASGYTNGFVNGQMTYGGHTIVNSADFTDNRRQKLAYVGFIDARSMLVSWMVESSTRVRRVDTTTTSVWPTAVFGSAVPSMVPNTEATHTTTTPAETNYNRRPTICTAGVSKAGVPITNESSTEYEYVAVSVDKFDNGAPLSTLIGEGSLGASRKKDELVAVNYAQTTNLPNFLWIVSNGALKASGKSQLLEEHQDSDVLDVRIL